MKNAADDDHAQQPQHCQGQQLSITQADALVDRPADELRVEHAEDIDQQHHQVSPGGQLPVRAQVAETAQQDFGLGGIGQRGGGDG